MNTRKAMMPYLNECGIVCPLGATHSEIKARLFERAESGVLPTDAWSPGTCLAAGQRLCGAAIDAGLALGAAQSQ